MLQRIKGLSLVVWLTVLVLVSGSMAFVAVADAQGKIGTGRVLRVAIWGGDWAANQHEAVGKRFEEVTGARVQYVHGNPVDNMTRLLAARGTPPFDVMQLDSLTEAMMIERGLFEKIDHSRFPVFQELYPEALLTRDYGPAFTAVPVVIAYLPAAYERVGLDAPETFDDLLDPRLVGRWAFPSPRVGFAPNILAGLSYHWYGDVNHVVDAIERLAGGKPRIYGATPEMATWLANGEVYAAVTHTAQAVAMKNQGMPIEIVYPRVGDLISMVYWNQAQIVRGTPNRDLAEIWLEIQASAEAHLIFARRMGAVPLNMKAAAALEGDEEWGALVISPEDMKRMFQADPAFVNANREAWVNAWNRIMGQ